MALYIPLTAFSQGMGEYVRITDLGEFLRATPEQMREMTGESYGTIGTPYVYPEFKKGNIYFTDMTAILNAPINYDCYNNLMLISRGETHYILNNHLIDFIEFKIREDSTVRFKQVFLVDKKKTVFMKVLYSKESTLYKYFHKSFQKADYTGAYSQDRRYDEYIDNHAWYIQLSGEEIQRLKPKKKAILQVLEPEKEEIGKFLKKEKLDLKSDQDLVRLVKLYDELQKTQFP
jgi:hypothetical protein